MAASQQGIILPAIGRRQCLKRMLNYWEWLEKVHLSCYVYQHEINIGTVIFWGTAACPLF